MFSTPGQAVPRLALAGLFLFVTVAGRPLHWRLLTAGGAEHICACRGCPATKGAGPGTRGTLFWERDGKHGDHDPGTCAICQFFARGKAIAAGNPVLNSPEPIVQRIVAVPLFLIPGAISPYESRGPPLPSPGS